MNQKLMQMAESYIKQRRRRMQLFRAVTALALVVAICTSYVLILPGLTLAAATYCGMEEHVHTAQCYVDNLSCLIEERDPSKVITEFMNCTFEPHVHTSGCRNAVGELCCGYWDKTVHTHDDFCYDSEGILICTLPEVAQHKHTDKCYSWEETLTCEVEVSEGHHHSDDCYILSEEPTCGLETSEGHHHDATCTVTERTLNCGMDVSTQTDMPHEHTDDCYTVTTTHTCGLEEGEGAHEHTAACYARAEAPICGLEEGEGAHTHGDDCYDKERGELTCDKYPEKVHTHSRDCFDEKTGYCVCGYVEVLAHQHTAACIRTVVAEDSGHKHGEGCYTRTYTCTLPVHQHSDDCYVPVEEETPDEPTATPEVTEAPTATPTAEPVEDVATDTDIEEEPTVEPTEEPTEKPTEKPTTEPAATPETDEVATGTDLTENDGEAMPTATVEPTVTPEMGILGDLGNLLGSSPLLGMGNLLANDTDTDNNETETDNDENSNNSNDSGEGSVKATDLIISELTFDSEQWGATTDGSQYSYQLHGKLQMPVGKMLEYDKNNKKVLDIENLELIKDNDHWPITGTIEGYKGTAFYIGYDPENDQLLIWFDDAYIAHVQETAKTDPGEAPVEPGEPDKPGDEPQKPGRQPFWNEPKQENYNYLYGYGWTTEKIEKQYQKDLAQWNDWKAKKDAHDQWEEQKKAYEAWEKAHDEWKKAYATWKDQKDNYDAWYYEQANGSFNLSAYITKDDVENKANDEAVIDGAIGGTTVEVKRNEENDGGKSLVTNLTAWKSGNDVDWKNKTMSYKAGATSTTGTHGNPVTLTDTITMDGAITLGELTNVKFGDNDNYNYPVVAYAGAPTVDGTQCGCGQTGMHGHYQITNTADDRKSQTVVFVLPPLDEPEYDTRWNLSYDYTFNVSGLEGVSGDSTTTAKNKISAETGGDGTWGHTTATSNEVTRELKTQKIKKSGAYDKEDSRIHWTLNINNGYLNVSEATLTDTMLGQVMSDGKLVFTAEDGKGYVESITATKTDGTSVTINAENYSDYFTVTPGENGSASLTFKSDLADDLKNSQFEIKYATYYERTDREQTVYNNAEFDGAPGKGQATVPVADTIGVTKSYDSIQYDNGVYTVKWNTTYQFTANSSIVLNFGDDLQYAWDNPAKTEHYFTASQMQEIITQLAPIIEAHQTQKVGFTLTVKETDYEDYDYNTTASQVWTYDPSQGESTETTFTLDSSKTYRGFAFVTTDSAGVTLTAEEETGAYTLQLSYDSTVNMGTDHDEKSVRNKAYNTDKKNAYAEHKIPAKKPFKVEKKFDSNTTLNALTDEIKWKITITNGGEAHTQIDLTDVLPPHLKVTKVQYGGATFGYKDGSFSDYYGQPSDKDEGYVVSWHDSSAWVKLDVTEPTTDTHQQTLTISLKQREMQNEGEEKRYDSFWSAEKTENNTTTTNVVVTKDIIIYCQLDEDAKETAATNDGNGTYTFNAMKNSVEATIDGATDSKLTATTDDVKLTYTDKSEVKETLKKAAGDKTWDSNYGLTQKFSVQVNPAEKSLMPSASQLTLVDTVTYEVTKNVWVGSTVYIYYQTVTIDPGSVKLYEVKRDENGKPVLNKDGNMEKAVPEKEISGWFVSVDYATESFEDWWPADNYSFAPPIENVYQKFEKQKKVEMNLTVPDNQAFILEYTCKVDFSLPTGATYTLKNIYDWGNASYNPMKAAFNNTVELKGTSEKSSSNVSNNAQIGQSATLSYAAKLTIKKTDSLSDAIFLKGTEFALYCWDSDKEAFVDTGRTLTADAVGEITFRYANNEGEVTKDLNADTAYLLFETKAVAPYVLPSEDKRVLVPFHVIAADDAANTDTYPGGNNREWFRNATAEALKPYLKDANGNEIKGEVIAPKTLDGSGTIQIPIKNERPRRSLTVTKAWEGENADQPTSVSVTLKRYAVPQSVYDTLTAGSDGEMFSEEAWDTLKDNTSYQDTTFSQEASLTAAGGWTLKFENLEANDVDADGNGIVYVYYVEETAPEKYAVAYVIKGDKTSLTGDVAAAVTNTYHPDQLEDYINLKLTKAWDEESIPEADQPKSVQVRLVTTTWVLARSEENGTGKYSWTKDATSYGEWQTISASNDWKLNSYTGLVLYEIDKNTDGYWTGSKAYTYELEENTEGTDYVYELTGALAADPADYFTEITDDAVTPKDDGIQTQSLAENAKDVAVTMTNSTVNEYKGKATFTVAKVWDENVKTKPSYVTITLKPTAWKLNYNATTKTYSWTKYDWDSDPDGINKEDSGYSWLKEELANEDVSEYNGWKWQSGERTIYSLKKDGSWSGYALTYELVEKGFKYDYTVSGLATTPDEYFQTDKVTPKGTATNGTITSSFDVTLTNKLKTEFNGELALEIQKEWEVKDGVTTTIPDTVTVTISRTRWNWTSVTVGEGDESYSEDKWVEGSTETGKITLSKGADGLTWAAVNATEAVFGGSSTSGLKTFYLKYEYDDEGQKQLSHGSYVYIYTVSEDLIDNYSPSYEWTTQSSGATYNLPTKPEDYFGLWSIDPKSEKDDALLTITNNTFKPICIKKSWEGATDEERLDLWVKITPQETVSSDWYSKVTIATTPSTLKTELTKIGDNVYLHVYNDESASKDEWEITIEPLPAIEYIVEEVEADGFESYYSGLNPVTESPKHATVKAGDSEDSGGNGYDTLVITNSPTKLYVNKYFVTRKAGNQTDSAYQEESVAVTTTVYFEVYRVKYDMNGQKVGTGERFTDLRLADEARVETSETEWYERAVDNNRIKLTVNNVSGASFTLNRLPKYWFDSSTGDRGLWHYYLKEVDANGNELWADIDYGWNWITNTANTDVTVSASSSVSVTNVVTDITVRKVWLKGTTETSLPAVDLTLKRAKTSTVSQANDDTISTVHLWRDQDGNVHAKLKDGSLATGVLVELQNPEEGSTQVWWGYKWINLPVYQPDGTPYYYYVEEAITNGSGWQQAKDSAATTLNPIDATSDNRTFQITNEKINYTLPETGGIGTLPYTLGGAVLMGMAAFLLGQEVRRRRNGC